MSRARSLTNLIADCRQRAGMENSTFVTDAEITEILNQELAELWNELVLNEGQPFYRNLLTIAVTAGTALYSLPADFLEVQQVEATVNGISGCLRPFMQNERAWLRNNQSWHPNMPVMYRIQGANIEFLPSDYAFSAALYYTPCQPRLVNGADTFDGFNGYESAAINGTVATMLAKEESDPSYWLQMRERVYITIRAMASRRDASNPERVQDVLMADAMNLPWGWM